MGQREDTELLAILVHRGVILKDAAERIFPALKQGGDLAELLEHHAGLAPDVVARLVRTRGGEIPEIPGYQILGKAGTGGTADVFRAREKKTARVLALKVLKLEALRQAGTRQSFIAEARLLERLRHRGLVKGFGVAKSGAVYFSKLEFIEGRTLLELLDDGQVFDEKAALRVVLEMAEVLQYLATEGVVHRDLKPGNIMFSQDGNLKLIDLGFAAGAALAPLADGGEGGPLAGESTVGTVAYIAPEQARGQAGGDVRSDIYSLGVTLFHLVVGRLPFESSDDREVLRMQVMDALSSPELKSRGLSHHLHYFIEKMMAKDVEARYQSWKELADDIRGQLEGRASLDFEAEVRARTTRGPHR